MLIFCVLQTIKPADIATVRKLAKPPHLIMRIMDCVLILFTKKLDTVTVDPERRCIKPSWIEAMKVKGKVPFFLNNRKAYNTGPLIALGSYHLFIFANGIFFSSAL